MTAETADLHILPVDRTKAREHITVPVEEFCARIGELLADAEDKGSRAILLALVVPLHQHSDIITEMGASRDIRARLYAAQLKRIMRGME